MRHPITNTTVDWSAIIDNLHESIITTDPEGYITNWNKGAERLFGYTAEEAIGLHAEICHQRSRKALEQEIIAPLQRDSRLEVFGKMVRRSGETFDGHMLTSLITAPDGRVTGMVGYTLDITDKRRAEDELAVQTNLLRRAEKSSHVGHFHRPLIGGQIYWSDELYQIFGVDKETFVLTQESVLAHLHPDDAERYVELVGAAATRGDSFETEVRAVRPDGEIRCLHAEIETEASGSGEPVAIFGVLKDITDQKRAEQALAESEERFDLAMRGSNDGLWDWDLKSDHIYRSDRYYEILGYEFGEIPELKESGTKLIHPDDLAAHSNFLARMSDGGTDSQEVELRFRHKKGHYLNLLLRASEVRDGKGNTVRRVGTISDITDRKQMENELRLSESRLSEALRIAHMGHFEYDPATDTTWWSDEVYQLFGVPIEQGAPNLREVLDFVPIKDRSAATEALQNAIDNGGSFSFEHGILLKDGTRRIFHSMGEAQRDSSGQVIRLTGTNQDITEAKNIEAELIATQAQAESAARIRQAFENVTVGNIVITSKGVVENFNATAEGIFGYAAEEVVGRNIKMLMPEADRQRHDGYLLNYLGTGDAKVIGIGRELVGLRKNGDEFPMHLGVGEMIIGGEVSFVGSVTDLSDMKALEYQLRQSQRMEAVGQLTGGVAHDFNNLMAIMMGNAELLEDFVGDDEYAKKRIQAIKAAVDRGASLTGRLLAFSRKQTLSPTATDISDLIGGLEDMIRRTLGETVDLRVADMPDLWPATIDPHQFENALLNLTINARDAMTGGGALTIEAAKVPLDETYVAQFEDLIPGDYIRVAVSDTGAGMSPEVLEKVFEPFFTTKDVGEGSGLGLSMVYGFVKQSGGHITIYSEVDHGATINLYLPRSREAVTGADTEGKLKKFARGSERILVVEDDADVRHVAVSTLAGQGYEIAEVHNGETAVARLTEGKAFDLLFTDVVLPGGMNGVEIAARAKQIQPNIKVLFATGYAENAVVHNEHLNPGVALVNKPYRRAELLEKVRAMLDGRNA